MCYGVLDDVILWKPFIMCSFPSRLTLLYLTIQLFT